MKTIDNTLASCCFPPRAPQSHKGDYGHALLCAGSFGMMGAAVLAARACMRGGAGKLTVLIPGAGYLVMQTAVPEAMAITDPDSRHLTVVPDLSPYDAIAVGPGLGSDARTVRFTGCLLAEARRLAIPTVADADALNHLALNPAALKDLPPETILTPHPGEFGRLVAGWRQSGRTLPEADSPEAEQQLLLQLAAGWQTTLVLKGHRTRIASPDGNCYENSTGNAGMATAGSGDVLTGLMLALMTQLACARRHSRATVPGMDRASGMSLTDLAACTACFVHGLAGDLAVLDEGMTSLVAGDIISHIGQAVKSITS